MSSSPERVRVRGRSPAFNVLASMFESTNARNLSTPPPPVLKLYPKSATPDSGGLLKPRKISALAATFDKQPPPARGALFARTVKAASPIDPKKTEAPKPAPKPNIKLLEVEDDQGLTIYPYERLKTRSINPAPDIDVTKRESYLSSSEFMEKFGMPKTAFYKLPKWKQNKQKIELELF